MTRGRWLSLPITGLDRLTLPLPLEFKLFQWSHVDRMGVGIPLPQWSQRKPIQFGIVDLRDIKYVAPIVQIGELPSLVTGMRANGPTRALRAALKARVSDASESERPSVTVHSRWPWYYESLLRPGPLFALNVSAYM